MPRRGRKKRRGRILVAAGTNGAGKSIIVGEFLAGAGAEYFNPDLFAQKLAAAGRSPEEANALAWRFGYEALQTAIAADQDFSFETTLGGTSIVRELHRAIDAGLDVVVWYVGLASAEQHIARVQARVARGGHGIPAARIRERYPRSLANLISLIGRAREIHVFDNSEDTSTGVPAAKLVIRLRASQIVEPDVPTLLERTPDWAKPVVAAAISRAAPPAKRRRKK